ncbi:MAG: 50S ribosomal protein L6 [Halanaerobiales bacterium]|nr:50S ribosomal protein L6 [Halanaerobiales bacterium]
MSRIGKLPIEIPEKVEIKIEGNRLTAKGPKGQLTREFSPLLSVQQEDNQIVVKRKSDQRQERALHGLTRSLINGMVEGVTKGFEKKLTMVGVGYHAKLKGKDLELEAGYSHPVLIKAPAAIEFEVEKTNITVKGIDKQQVGEIAAKIRAVRKPEPYKGKGIKYADEQIRRKVGKTG